MIARLWHGVTHRDAADEYVDVLHRTGIPDYEHTDGNKGVFVFRRTESDRTHFVTLSLWESRAAIEAFAGADVDRARYYPEDEDYLLEFEDTVEHYEVVYEPAS